MVQTIATRVAQLIMVLVGVSFLIFMLLELLPGDAAEVLVAESGDASPAAVAKAREDLGLDQPTLVRFANWTWSALGGDLGTSYRNGQEVSSAIAGRLPATLQLLVMAQIFALIVAIPAAIYVAQRRDSLPDRVGAVVAFGLQAIPNFMFALLMILLLAVNLGIAPAIGYVPLTESVGESIRSLMIPTLALASGIIPVYLRVLRGELLQTLQEDYILVGRSVGLPRRTLLYGYALRPSLPTLVTVVGVNVGILMGGSVVVEVISGVPGIGTLLLSSILTLDYIMVQGIVLVIAATYVLVNFGVDLLQLAINPKLRA